MKEKTIKSKDVGCPSCGATMKYSPEKQKLFCDNCKTCRDIEFLPVGEKCLWNNRNKGTKSTKDWANHNKALKCKNCGASVVINNLEYTNNCPYCDSVLIAEDNEQTASAPDGIIPFKLTKEEFCKLYVKGVKKKFFVPKPLKKEPPVENIKPIYIPSFSFDAKSKSKYKGVLANSDYYTDIKGNRKAGTTYKNISGKHEGEHVDVVVESSSKINQAQIAEILPYNMSEMVKFNQGFIMGYVVEQYETTVEECEKISKLIMKENIKKNILSRYNYDRVVSFNLESEFSEEKYMYYLLPIYKCDFKYKNKKYTTFMNGQSGKVGGGFPISPIKVTFTVLGAILLMLAIILLVMNIKP